MADPKSPTTSGGTALNPKAAAFTMPAPNEVVSPNGTTQPTETAGTNGNEEAKGSKKSKQPRPDAAPRPTTEQNVADAGAGGKLTGAALKKHKAAEKAARRAEKVAAKGEPAALENQAKTQAQAGISGSEPETQRRPSTTKRENALCFLMPM